MEKVIRFAVIPTHNRPQDLAHLITSLVGQCDSVIVIDNASSPRVNARDLYDATNFDLHITVIRDDEQPPNLYRLWNIGLNAAEMIAGWFKYPHWDVAILNDDTDVPSGWYDTMAQCLRNGQTSPAAVSGDVHGELQHAWFVTSPDTRLMTRMCPWAFVTRGELGIRADESFRWWWGDTDFEWQLRKAGGVMLIPRHIVTNKYANQSTVGVLAEQAALDRETFAKKWGHVPW